MLNSWIADAVGKAFANNISHKEIAAKAGYNPRYLSAILNQKRNPANAEIPNYDGNIRYNPGAGKQK